MNIWLITIGEQLPIKEGIRKLRTAYLADELLARGHSILWWSSAFDHFKKEWVAERDTEIDINASYKIKLLRGTGYKKNISLGRIRDHRIIAKKFKQYAPHFPKPDIIVVSMPTYDLAYEATKFANAHHIPILVDIRDQWPDIFVDKSPLPKAISKLILRKEFKLLQNCLKNATGIIAVSQTFLNWGLEYVRRKQKDYDQVFYLGYKKNPVVDITPLAPLIEKIKNKFVITFIGTFEEYHDPSILIECAKKLKANPGLHFVLAGDGALKASLIKQAEELQNVTFTGWLKQSEIDLLLSYSHVGVCPTTSKTSIFPNKAFAYLAYELPILSAFEGDLKTIINDYQVGFFFDWSNVEMLVDKINLLKNAEQQYQAFRRNAQKLYTNKLDGAAIYRQYADHIYHITTQFYSKKAGGMHG